MFFLIVFTFAFGAICAATQTFSIPHVNITFDKSPTPFTIYVDRDFIEDTRQRVAHTRAPDFIGVTDEGPAANNYTLVKDFWVNEYSWEKAEAAINEQ